jgi:hypothetical protein
MEQTDESGAVTWSNPLAWWKLKEFKYPELAKLARKVLAIPATSAPSERMFSVAGLTATKLRNRLSGDTVSLLVWLHSAWNTVVKWMAGDEVGGVGKTKGTKRKL